MMKQFAINKTAFALIGLTIVSLILLLVVIVPYCKDGTLSFAVDYSYHLARIENIAAGLKGGQFPVRIHPDALSGYGYANSLFYPELFLYLPALLVLLGMSGKAAFLAFLWMIFVFAGTIVFFFAKKLFGGEGLAFAAAVLFLAGQYFYMTAVFRAAIGELCGMAFAPLIVWGLYNYTKEEFSKPHLLLLGVLGVTYSHSLSLFLDGIFIVVVALVHFKLTFTRRYLLKICSIVGIWLLASLALFVPMLEQFASDEFFFSHNDIDVLHVENNTYSLIGMIYAGYVQPYSVGLPALACLVLRAFIKGTEKNREARKALNRALVLLLVCIVLPLDYVPWKWLGKTVFGVLQFPWRVLMLTAAVFPLYIVGCFIEIAKSPVCLSDVVQKRWVQVAAITTLCIAFSVYGMAFMPNKGAHIDEKTFEIGYGEWLPYAEGKTVYDYYQMAGDTSLQNSVGEEVSYERKEHSVTLTFYADRDEYTLPLLYYKGYEARGEDGAVLSVSPSDENKVVVHAADYTGQVILSYVGTPLQTTSYIVSALTVFASAGGMLLIKKRSS